MRKILDANLLGIKGELSELAPLAKANGFDAIGVPVGLLEDATAATEATKQIEGLGLSWGLLPTPTDFFSENVDEPAFEEALEKLKRWASLGEKMGITRSYNHVWPASHRPFEENFFWHVERLQKLQQVFKDHGIAYGFEALGPHELREMAPHPFVHTLAGVLAIADAAGGYTGFIFDTFHWYTGSRRPDDLYFALQNTHRLVNIHLNDGVAGRTPDQQKDLERALPMETGVIDSRSIYQLFEKSPYDGPCVLEPMMPTTTRFASIPADEAVVECRVAFDRLEERVTK
ncbi:MAG: sugar phosphate isomerase/epimerase [Clostridia bacterium]|nr:sugar phosphate isomerase/epimerase [Clostridia bacterium]